MDESDDKHKPALIPIHHSVEPLIHPLWWGGFRPCGNFDPHRAHLWVDFDSAVGYECRGEPE